MIEKHKRIINNEKNVAAKDGLKFLNSLKTKCSEKIGTLLEDYVERWIEITDRGESKRRILFICTKN